MTLSKIESTRSGSDMSAKLSVSRGMGYRPVPAWQAKASRTLGMRPATVRDLAPILRERVEVMLASMVECGASGLAGEWVAGFEAALVVSPLSWTQTFKVATAADAKQDVQVGELAADRSEEALNLYEACLRKEVAAKLAELRALEVRRGRS